MYLDIMYIYLYSKGYLCRKIIYFIPIGGSIFFRRTKGVLKNGALPFLSLTTKKLTHNCW